MLDKPSIESRRGHWLPLFALLYCLIAGTAAWQTIQHSNAAAGYLKQACDKATLQNEGAQLLARFNLRHPLIGIFVSPSVDQYLKLPSLQQSSRDLGEFPRLIQLRKQELAIARPWSWLLVGVSLMYVISIVAICGAFITRHLLYSVTCVSIFLFVVGITAPAISILTIPAVPVLSEKLEFVLQCEVRSLSTVIVSLFSSGWWVVASLVTLFGIITPLTKIGLSLFAATTASSSARDRVSRFLHAIGKWSMTDVFVAAVLLGMFAMKSQPATRAFPCIGLYYFAGYCMLSMTSALLLSSPKFATEALEGDALRPQNRLELATATGFLGFAIALAVVSVTSQYEQTAVQAQNTVAISAESERVPKPQRRQYTGEVTSIDAKAGTLIVKKGAESKTFKIGEKTKYSTTEKPKGTATVGDIQVGDKVTVHYTDVDGVLTAHSIVAFVMARTD